MARKFGTTTDVLTTSIGQCNIGFGTMVFIGRRPTDNSNTHPFALRNLAGTGRMRMQVNATDEIRGSWASGIDSPTIRFTQLDNWCLIAVGKATGTTTPRFHKYAYDTNVWEHEDGASTNADATLPGATGLVRIGGDTNGTNSWMGEILIAGIYAQMLTDQEVENLPFSLASWFEPTQFCGGWLLDQSDITQSVVDFTGNGANQSALSGTTVATVHPPIWNRGFSVSYLRSATVVPARANRLLLMGVGR